MTDHPTGPSPTNNLIVAITDLRQAQRDYMANRGNDARGKLVGQAAERVDAALDALDPARIRAFSVIDTERAYQNMRMVRDGSTADDEHPHTPEEFLLYMEHYMHLAREVASTVWGPECKPQLLDVMRKVVTLGVACFEQHGCPPRKM